MTTNRGVVYVGPGKVEVKGIDYPKFVAPNGKEIDHGVILRIVSTNICGSDQHMVRGRTTAPSGLASAMRSPEKSLKKERESSSSKSGIWSLFHSTSRAVVAETAKSKKPVSV